MSATGTSPPRDPVTVHPPVYPMLARVVRHGDPVVRVGALLVLVIGGNWAWRTAEPLWILVSIGVALVTYVLGRIGVELVRLVCDMLLPK